MTREFCTKCAKCRERTVRLAPVLYCAEFAYDGGKYVVEIPDLVVPQCSKCGSFSFDHEACCQIDDAFRKQIGLLSPDEIRSQREALSLTRQQLADHLRIDVATLERWESDFQMQSRSLDLLMRGFFKNPDFWKSLSHDTSLAAPAAKGREQPVATLP